MNFFKRMFLAIVMFFKKNDECKEVFCKGKIDKKKSVSVMTGCMSMTSTYPCDECGRLHWDNGRPIFNKPGQKAFLTKTGEIMHK
ncbi:MAG: hypothetical protein WC933_01600 [Candidatus Paceibacterota bacterium]|jgi:uncharacterized protein with PIN domain